MVNGKLRSRKWGPLLLFKSLIYLERNRLTWQNKKVKSTLFDNWGGIIINKWEDETQTYLHSSSVLLRLFMFRSEDNLKQLELLPMIIYHLCIPAPASSVVPTTVVSLYQPRHTAGTYWHMCYVPHYSRSIGELQT